MGSPDLTDAIAFATKRHAGQFRDGAVPIPYITHPIEVLLHVRHTAQVTEPEMLCAAILHDVVEECGVRYATLEKRFGHAVAELVRELTREEPSEKVRQKLNKGEIVALRNRLLLAGIARMSPRAQVVKLADRLANVIDAKRTRAGEKLKRYLVQSREILSLIPRDRCPALWDGIVAELPV